VVRKVGEEDVRTWNDVRWVLLKEAVKRESVLLEVENERGGRATRRLDLAGVTKDDLDRDFLGKLGLRPFRPKSAAVLAA
jgi:regulator of sigma E protease